MSVTRKMDKQAVVHLRHGLLLSNRKEQTTHEYGPDDSIV